MHRLCIFAASTAHGNMRSFYRFDVQPDLFGGALLVRRWGGSVGGLHTSRHGMPTQEQKFQVFISSTWSDLIEERNAVSLAVLRASHIPAGMELSSGANERTLDILYQWIDACDVFILILAGRYGAVSPTHGLSYTRLEYEYARKLGLPIITIVLTDNYIEKKIAANKLKATNAFERKEQQKLDEFRHIATSERYCIILDNDINELESNIYRVLNTVKQTYSINGWVRRESCLEAVADAYAHYIDLYLSIYTDSALLDDRHISSILRALHQIIMTVVCPTIGWVDVFVPTVAGEKDRPHLLIDGIVKNTNWLRLRYSSVPRTHVPTLIPISVHDVPWRGSGSAFTSKGVDYVPSLVDSFPRRMYKFSPMIDRKIKDIYSRWKSTHYFSSLFSICVTDVDCALRLRHD
jgi:hypothetical protein